MAEGRADERRARRPRRGERHMHKRKGRKREKFIHNLKWMAGGIAVGLPVLAVLIYAVSQY